MRSPVAASQGAVVRVCLLAGLLPGLLLGLGAGCAATEAGRLKQDTFQARKKLTRELIVRGDWQGAFAYADDLHREQPGDSEVLVLRGTVYRERGLPSESEADLLEAVRLDDQSAEGHAALAILYDVTRRAGMAESEHRRAVKLAPGNSRYLNNLGFSLFLRGKNKEAVDVYQQAARLDPTSKRVRTNLGFAYAATGDLRRAAHEFDMAGTVAEAKNNLGFAYERRGDMTNAYDLYLEAARLDPKSPRVRSNLVHAASALKRELPADVDVTPATSAPPAGGGVGDTAAPSQPSSMKIDEENRP